MDNDKMIQKRVEEIMMISDYKGVIDQVRTGKIDNGTLKVGSINGWYYPYRELQLNNCTYYEGSDYTDHPALFRFDKNGELEFKFPGDATREALDNIEKGISNLNVITRAKFAINKHNIMDKLSEKGITFKDDYRIAKMLEEKFCCNSSSKGRSR